MTNQFSILRNNSRYIFIFRTDGELLLKLCFILKNVGSLRCCSGMFLEFRSGLQYNNRGAFFSTSAMLPAVTSKKSLYTPFFSKFMRKRRIGNFNISRNNDDFRRIAAIPKKFQPGLWNEKKLTSEEPTK